MGRVEPERLEPGTQFRFGQPHHAHPAMPQLEFYRSSIADWEIVAAEERHRTLAGRPP